MSFNVGPRVVSATGGSIKRVGNYRIHTFPSELVTDGLVLNLDAGDPRSYPGSGTTWTDLSGNGNSGTFGASTAAPTYNNANGGSLVFDGTNDYVVSTTSNNLGNTNSSPSISIEMWAKITRKSGGGQQFQHIAGYRTSNFEFYVLLLDSSGGTVPTETRITTLSGTYDISVDFAPYTGVWTHIVFTATSNRSNLYINGSLVGSNTSISGNFGSSSGNFTVGITPTDLAGFAANGNISSVKVYNKTLSAAEIAQNYDALKVRYTSYTNTFTPTCGGGSGKVEVLCVAGGGGGGSFNGGGGGAGGLLYNSAFTVNSNTGIGVTIGAGGIGDGRPANGASGGSGVVGTNGGNSVFSSLTAIGGGVGATYGIRDGVSGGSGGGSWGSLFFAGGTAGQGNAGGGGYPIGNSYTETAGGGGGAGGNGVNGGTSSNQPGAGGLGLLFNISGNAQFYAAGGAAGANRFGGSALGGSGIGGNGGTTSSLVGVAGVPNTGSGGGGAAYNGTPGSSADGGNGSNGIIIVRYPATDYNVELLIVGGGGSGGTRLTTVAGAGGGGAGGLIYYSSYPVSAGTKYSVTVGAGGNSQTSNNSNGNQGSPSVGFGLIAIGGGYGGAYASGAAGGPGGSGGGGGRDVPSIGGSGTPGQGNSGGAGQNSGGNGTGGGGGGGAAGGAGTGANGGIGGVGLSYSISGTATYYAGGGGGASYGGNYPDNGGLGGGGKGATENSYQSPVSGTTNTGGGGGGGGVPSGAGGSGIIIIAYQGPQRGVGGTVDTTSRPGYTLHKFTTTGTDFFIP